jgi:hypothetical protein
MAASAKLACGVPPIKQKHVAVRISSASEVLLVLVKRLRQILPVRLRFGIIHPVGEQMDDGFLGAQTVTERPAPELLGEIRRNGHGT